jgi:hypothetical protein
MGVEQLKVLVILVGPAVIAAPLYYYGWHKTAWTLLGLNAVALLAAYQFLRNFKM